MKRNYYRGFLNYLKSYIFDFSLKLNCNMILRKIYSSSKIYQRGLIYQLGLGRGCSTDKDIVYLYKNKNVNITSA